PRSMDYLTYRSKIKPASPSGLIHSARNLPPRSWSSSMTASASTLMKNAGPAQARWRLTSEQRPGLFLQGADGAADLGLAGAVGEDGARYVGQHTAPRFGHARQHVLDGGALCADAGGKDESARQRGHCRGSIVT